MQTLIWKLFPPYEVKLTIEAAKTFLSQTAKLPHDLILPEVIALARDAPKTVYSVRIDRMRPDHLALLLTTNVLGRYIGSGHYHTYRGVLNVTGQDMLKIWYEAQTAMLEGGYISEKEMAKDNQWIKQQINIAG
ncbi:MAG: hypothetical protein ACHQAZ_03620 [Gammaproteobacteria bacterium]